MKCIALTGRIATGKTAVAQELLTRGYLLVSLTDLLKEIVAHALSSVSVPTTLNDILADKERYRALIQEFGTVIGFDQGGVFLSSALEVWRESGWRNCVIDNVRTDEQAEQAARAGFHVVRLVAHREERVRRLLADGKNPDSVLAREAHHIESGIADHLVDIQIETDHITPREIALFLDGLLEDVGEEQTNVIH